MSRRLIRFLSLCTLGGLLATASTAVGQREVPLEYEVKAAFLYNFARFVEWPDEAFESGEDPFLIGVLGDNPFDDALNDAVRDKVIDDRPVRVLYAQRIEDLPNVHLLYISESETGQPYSVAGRLQDGPVLTVSDVPHFTREGGMIRFFIRDRRVAFEINIDAAERAGLRVSSRLLNVAQIYRE